MNAGAVFTVAVILWICATVSGKGQFLSQTVKEWDEVMGAPYETSSCASHKNGIVTAKYRTGDIFCDVTFENGTAVRVDMHFHLFESDWQVAGIQRNVLNGTFEVMQGKAVAPIFGVDWYQDNVLHFTVKNDWGHEIAILRIERDTITMVLSNAHGYFDISR